MTLNLKTLSEPKWQKIILEKDLNPEHPKIEPNTKISKLFKNCSTFTQSDFNFRNVSAFFGDKDTKFTISNPVMSEIQQKISKKLHVLEKSWNRV